MSMILDGSNGVTFNDASLQGAAASPFVLKNRLINGAMLIDQRNAGASVTPTNTQYTLDRWQAYMSASSKYSVQQNAGSVTPPTGYKYYLGITSASSYTVGAGETFSVRQQIEGYNVSDLAWGTANAQTVTLSFWVRSSLTGTFGGAFRNDNGDRSYPFTYTISVANTWEQKTITVTGCPNGTWLSTNGSGIQIWMGIGVGSTYSGTAGAWASADYRSATGATSVVGTNGATFYITGVQLEIGTSATPFERRLYNQELANCQRYYWKFQGNNANIGAWRTNGGNCSITIVNPVDMRTSPSFTKSGTIAFYSYTVTDASNITYVSIFYQTSLSGIVNFSTTGAGASANGLCGYAYGSGYIDISAEL